MALERNPAYRVERKTIYTCPMHPQIEQDHPGSCPICGMALEPKTVSGGEENEEEEVREAVAEDGVEQPAQADGSNPGGGRQGVTGTGAGRGPRHGRPPGALSCYRLSALFR